MIIINREDGSVTCTDPDFSQRFWEAVAELLPPSPIKETPNEEE